MPTLPIDDGGADDVSPPGALFARGELAGAAGLEAGQVEQLESFGLITPALEIGGEPRYDGEALEVARAAAGFFARGVEARHLRMYRTFAEREAVLFGQVLLPYVRQRNPEARARLQDELVELVRARPSSPYRAVARSRSRVAHRVTVPKTLLDEAAIQECVARVAKEIAADHPDGVILVGVLKGALIFLADLARALSGIEVAVDFIAISRYAPDSGRVRILHDVGLDLTGRDVVLVEDLVDTGLTIAYLLDHLRARGPRQLDVCALLDRSARDASCPSRVRYVGAVIPDVFVLGYGLHLADLYRNVPRVVEADRHVVQHDPGAYVGALYGA